MLSVSRDIEGMARGHLEDGDGEGMARGRHPRGDGSPSNIFVLNFTERISSM